MTVVKNIPIDFSEKEILSYLGYKPKKSELDPKTRALLDKMVARARIFISPAAVYTTLSVSEVGAGVIKFIGSDFSIEGSRVVNYLRACTKVTFAAATVGPEIEGEITDLFAAGYSAEAAVLDAVGSDAVEQVVEWVDNYISQYAGSRGYLTFSRISPGYSLWSIEANKEIAGLLGAQRIGLEVLPSFQLIPRKSVLAAIGWVENRGAGEGETES